jgi:uncharacterized protein (TIGR00251 family)
VSPANAPAWLRQTTEGVLIFVHLQPGARRTAACGEHGGRLKLAVAAPPLDGRANDALTEWLARRLELPRRQLRLVAGERSRDKTVIAEGLGISEALRRLAHE